MDLHNLLNDIDFSLKKMKMKKKENGAQLSVVLFRKKTSSMHGDEDDMPLFRNNCNEIHETK